MTNEITVADPVTSTAEDRQAPDEKPPAPAGAVSDIGASGGTEAEPSGHTGTRSRLMTLLTVLIPSALGVAAAAAILSSGMGSLINAMSENAAGYGAVFARQYTVAEAFLTAIALSRADFAIFFISMLCPYTAASRPLTAGIAFLRMLTTSMAIAVSLASPLGIASISAGAILLFFVLRRADMLYIKMRDDGGTRQKFRDCAESVLLSVVCSGGLLALRTLLLLIGGLFSAN